MKPLPDFKILTFDRNPKRSDIFDLQTPGFNKFKYFRLSDPRNGWIKSQGARHVIETWEKGSKVLFSGLIPFKGNIYYGDNKNPKTGRKSFIIAIVDREHIILYYFNSFSLYPKERNKFLNRFVDKLQLFPGCDLSNNERIQPIYNRNTNENFNSSFPSGNN